jgi:hypothetical protein
MAQLCLFRLTDDCRSSIEMGSWSREHGGAEAVVACKDVLQLDEAEARKVRRWGIRALVNAARRGGQGG